MRFTTEYVSVQSCWQCLLTPPERCSTGAGPTSYDLSRLPVLTNEPALELLGLLTPETVANYPAEAQDLVQGLEGLPLAIQVAGRILQTMLAEAYWTTATASQQDNW